MNQDINLRRAGDSLRKTARGVTALLWLAGFYSFMLNVSPLLNHGPETLTWGERRVLGIVALSTLGSFGLGAWVVGKVLKAAAELVEVFVAGAGAAAEAAYLIEAHVVPGMARAVAALERIAEGQASDAPNRAASSVRKAIADGRWGRAEQLIQAFRSGDPETIPLRDELARARSAEADDLRTRLDAARAAVEPDRVIDCRDALTQHLRGDALEDLDRRVVRWISDLIRARAGSVTPELAALAERAADTFADTPEGASLLASLPGLRVRAGLCPDCARPLRGGSKDCLDCNPAVTPKSGGAVPRGKP